VTGLAETGFPAELASETIARLYESQGLPHTAAAIRALCMRPARIDARPCDGAIEVSWQTSAPGPLLLRAVTFVPGEAPSVTDHEAESHGTMVLRIDGGWVCVAVGRSSGGRFVPLAHAAPVHVDSGERG